MSGLILDLFAGPGGWSEGLRMLGLADVGIEWDGSACQTRAAAGHLTVRADVSQYPTAPFVGKTWGLIASPPCQDFSMAGKRAGRTGAKGQLIDEVPRWVNDLRPEWFACEQVPPALEVWEEFAYDLRNLGYSTWAGVLNAADFGVPQTRQRAFLLGSRVRVAHPPAPTHAESPQETLFGDPLERWVTMAASLGWTGEVGFPRRDDTGTSADGYRERDWRDSDDPAFALTEKARSWVRRERSGERSEEGFDAAAVPSQTLTSEARSWTLHRPATTVMGDPRIAQPGHTGNAGKERSMTGAIRVSTSEALVLQSFPPDYPVAGSRSKQFEQIGNAVPPLLAAHVVSGFTGVGFLEQQVAA